MVVCYAPPELSRMVRASFAVTLVPQLGPLAGVVACIDYRKPIEAAEVKLTGPPERELS